MGGNASTDRTPWDDLLSSRGTPDSNLRPRPADPSAVAQEAARAARQSSPPPARARSLANAPTDLQMGAEAMGIIQTDISMWDPKVCRPFISGICPHDLFTNTVSPPPSPAGPRWTRLTCRPVQKMDLGSCPRTHSVKVKNEYEAALAKATADQDETKIAQLNQLKIDYEQVVRLRPLTVPGSGLMLTPRASPDLRLCGRV